MDLQTLRFKVETDELDVASKKLGQLVTSVEALNKANNESIAVSNKAATAAGKLASAQDSAANAAAKSAKANKETEQSVSPLEKLLNKLNNQYGDLVSGFTKGEAAILQQARAAGAAEGQLKPFADILSKIKELTKDPFDASVGSIRSISAEFDRAAARANLLSQGIALTTKQLGEYSRLAAEVKGVVAKLGMDPNSAAGIAEYNRRLKEAQADYLQVAMAVNKYSAEEKEKNIVLRSGAAVMTDSAKATEWLARELARAENAARGFNEELKMSTSNRLFKFEEMLKKSGISGEAATKMMNDYRNNIIIGQKKTAEEMDKNLRNMARAVSVQMGDVAVSLAGGMNPLLVMIQQGDQLRGVFQQLSGSGADVSKAMSTAASMIVSSFVDVGKAIGQFFLGALVSAGKSITGLVTGPVSAFLSSLGKAGAEGDKVVSVFDALAIGGKAFGDALNAAKPTLIFALVAAVAALGVALFKVSKEQDELTKQLALNGASMGMNTTSAIAFANSLNAVGVSTSKAVGLITALAKEGGFLASELSTIIPVGARLIEVFGMTSEEVAKLFAKIKKDPVAALYDLAISMGTVNLEVIRFVEEQVRLGNTLGATEAAMKEAARVNNEAADQMKQDYSSLGRAIHDAGVLFSKFWDTVKGLVYTSTGTTKLKEEFEELEERIKDEEKLFNFRKAMYGEAAANGKFLESLRLQAKEMKANILLQESQAKTALDNKAANSAQAKAMQDTASALKSAQTPWEKYNAVTQAAVNRMAQFPANAKLQADNIRIINQAAKEYNEALERQEKKLNQMSPVQKAFQTDLLRANKLRNAGIAAQENLTNAEKEYANVISGPNYASYSSSMKEELRVKYELAATEERRGNLAKEYAKTQEEMAKKQNAINVANAKAVADALVWSTAQNKTIADRAAFLALELQMVGQTDAARKLALGTLQAQVELEKEQVKIAALKGKENHQSEILQLGAEAIDRYNASIKAVNTEIALDFANKMAATMDSGGSFAKSAERFADALASAGNTSFSKVVSSLSSINDLFAEIADNTKRYNEEILNSDASKTNEILLKQKKAELKSYGDIAKAAKGFFKEGSTGYKTMMKLEKAFRAYEMAMAIKTAAVKIAENAKVVAATIWGYAKSAASAIASAAQVVGAKMSEGLANATAAVANQGNGDPYTAFPRIAAMIAIMAGLGFAVSGGGSGGGSAGSSSGGVKIPDWKNEGKGTVFGDKDAQSESIANGIQLLEDVNTLTMKYSAAMLQTLRSIDSKIGGVTNMILRSGAAAGVEGVAVDGMAISSMGKFAEKVVVAIGTYIGGPLGGALANALNNLPIVKKITQGIFGGKQTITGSGLGAADTSLGTILGGGLNLQQFTDVRTSGGWFRSDKNSTQTSAADASLNQQFSLIFKGFADAVKLAAVPLGANLDDVNNRLNSFVVKIGKIDLKDLTGEEIQEKLNAVFGAAGDSIAQAALPGLEKFQKVGEGYLETVIRVANGIETFTSWVDMLGFSVGALDIDATMSLIDMIGGVEELGSAFSSFYDNFYTEAEKTTKLTEQLTSAFGEFGLALPTTKLEYRAMLEKSIAEGNDELTIQLLKLSDAFAQITPDIEEATQTISDTLKDLQRESADLGIQLLQAQGRTEEANAAMRALAIEGMTPVEIAAWDANRAIEAQIQAIKDAAALADAEAKRIEQIAQQRLNLENQLLQAQGNTAAIRERELAALDPTNRELQLMIWALKDQADAAAEATRAAEELANKQRAIDQERYGLETQLLQLQGNTAELRARELAALDPSNRALMEQIWALQDQQAAAEEAAQQANEAAQAAQDAAREQEEAAQRIREAWQSITDSLYEEVARIRGLVLGESQASYSVAQSNFNVAMQKALAGDQKAAESLPELSRTMLDLAETQTKSMYELRRIQLITAASLDRLAGKYVNTYGLAVPAFASGGNYPGGMALVGEEGPELIDFNSSGRVYNASQTASALNNAGAIEAINKMNENLEMLRHEVRANVTHSAKTAKILDRVVTDGQTVAVRFLEPQQVTNV